MTVKTTGRIASVPVGDALIGRIVNPTGKPIDGKGDIITDKTRPIERVAPGIVARRSVYEPLQTGLTLLFKSIPTAINMRILTQIGIWLERIVQTISRTHYGIS